MRSPSPRWSAATSLLVVNLAGTGGAVGSLRSPEFPPTVTQSSPRLDEVIRRHTEARGGARALERVRIVESLAWITEPTFKVQGYYLATSGYLVRVDVFDGAQRVFSEGVDANGSWVREGGNAATVEGSEAGARALRHTVDFQLIPLHLYRRHGHRLTLAGRERIDGVEYFVVEAVLTDGFTTHFYLDPVSWMITRRRDQRAYHVDADSTKKWIESRFSDFRAVDGVKVPFRTEEVDLRSGRVVGESVVIWRRHSGDPGDRLPRAHVPTGPPPPPGI